METQGYYGVFMPPTGPETSTIGAIFPTLKDASKYANSPVGKSRGARFKRFDDAEGAKKFAETGSLLVNDDSSLETSLNFDGSLVERLKEEGFEVSDSGSSPQKSSTAVNEPTVSSPSVSKVQLNSFKRTIEQKKNDEFDSYLKENLRYIINTSSDTPTIILEGFRYNAMHIAARTGNLYVATNLLRTITDLSALGILYGTSEEDVRMRSEFLLDAYLNTPDKGANETPLHFACKFGHLGVIKMLLETKKSDMTAKNRTGSTAFDIICSRFNGNDKENLRHQIEQLFFNVFVSLYRGSNDHSDVVILISDGLPQKYVSSSQVGSSHSSKFLNEYMLCAMAGPFSDNASAEKFRDMWCRAERTTRISDPSKGSERVGRVLALRFNVCWKERWKFADVLIELQSFGGLQILNKYLCHSRCARKSSIITHSYQKSDPEQCPDSSRDEKIHKAEEEKCKTLSDTHLDLNDSAVADSLIEISNQKFADLDITDISSLSNVNDPNVEKDCEDDYHTPPSSPPAYTSDPNCCMDEEDGSHYFTPPTSPIPVYIADEFPSREDDELVMALSLVDADIIAHFWSVKEYIRLIKKVPAEERDRWPMADSPRAKKRRNP